MFDCGSGSPDVCLIVVLDLQMCVLDCGSRSPDVCLIAFLDLQMCV